MVACLGQDSGGSGRDLQWFVCFHAIFFMSRTTGREDLSGGGEGHESGEGTDISGRGQEEVDRCPAEVGIVSELVVHCTWKTDEDNLHKCM
jgi:hypothetical protein